jgi:Mrr N-terminal domain
MAIPDRQTLRLEILRHLSDNTIHNLKETLEYLDREKFRLTDHERMQRIPSGGKTIFTSRALWALTDLRKAGLITNVKKQKGIFKITNRGLEEIRSNPPEIDTKFLMRFPGYIKWLTDSRIKAVKRSIEKKKKKKITFKKGIIILLDVLGTKGKWKTTENAEISKLWNILTDTLSDAVNEALEGKNHRLTLLTFSDTIMIIVETLETKMVLVDLASSLRAPLVVSMMIGMPLRGCITTGEFHRDATLIVGPAIDEAAEYYDLPQWIGISSSPSANKIIEDIYNSKKDAVKDIFFKCDIPLKNSIEQNAWALQWAKESDKVVLETSKSLETSKLQTPKYTDTMHIMNNHLEKSYPIDVALKWRNTYKFYEITK